MDSTLDERTDADKPLRQLHENKMLTLRSSGSKILIRIFVSLPVDEKADIQLQAACVLRFFFRHLRLVMVYCGLNNR